jgi:hypothetical protein
MKCDHNGCEKQAMFSSYYWYTCLDHEINNQINEAFWVMFEDDVFDAIIAHDEHYPFRPMSFR